MTIQDISDRIRTIPDFPKPGIQFKDITPLLADADALSATIRLLSDPWTSVPVDMVVGIESRGFLLGPALAASLNAGFVPVRKPGKLPFRTLSATYELEYGTDRLEIHADAIRPGMQVLIHDDVVATGGTALAACELVERLGGRIVGFSFLIELSFLKGTERLVPFGRVEHLITV
jgi:adenine phosphoribosyltransferase